MIFVDGTGAAKRPTYSSAQLWTEANHFMINHSKYVYIHTYMRNRITSHLGTPFIKGLNDQKVQQTHNSSFYLRDVTGLFYRFFLRVIDRHLTAITT